MTNTIQVSDEIYAKAQKAAKFNHRSLDSQIQYWVNIGCTVDCSTEFSVERLKAAMKGELDLESLTAAEHSVFMDDLYASMRDPGPQADAYYASLGDEAKAVGYTGD